ncbi:hypothetical protein BIV60_08805 [Bacillus sp. MUM 116]|uniref:hypothetical protein n=1 Tax=Bacillus sp. MUM 116 TaxID=1678002 RepID=UPI0008F57E9C|nr:hypothetical protein [Bacillus sp. MUM 116]OIK15632.1 hypothetical protein BIV60_08805 [Bacillus sp. MUM 116]
MGLIYIFLIAWFALSIFFLMKKSLSNAVNILTFLFFQIVHINIFTILTLKLNFLIPNTRPLAFIAILLFRDISLPVFLLIYVNLLFSFKKIGAKLVVTAIIFFIIHGAHYIFLELGYFHYYHWSYFREALFDFSLMLICLVIAYVFKKLFSREKNMNGHLANL